MNSPILSVIVPVYNGEKTISNLVSKIKNEFIDINYEIILVNDCSQDSSLCVARELSQSNKNVITISLRKNFGEHNAVMCGLNYASGDYAVIVDDDLQNPPSEIRKLLNVARNQKYDVVYSVYPDKKHSFFRNFGSSFNGWVAGYLIDKPKNLYLSSFKIINRAVINEIIRYKGPFPYIDGLIFRVTKNCTSVTVDHHERAEGKSQYTLSKLIRLLSQYVLKLLNHSTKNFYSIWNWSPFTGNPFFISSII